MIKLTNLDRNKLITKYNRIFIGLIYLICVVLSSPDLAYSEKLIPVQIEKGSNLTYLARDYCTSRDAWKEIAKVNKLQYPYIIRENTTILIPFSLLLTEELSAQVVYVSGSVYLHDSHGVQSPLTVGDRLMVGQSIITGEDGYAQLIFPEKKFTRVEPETQLTISSLFRLVGGVVKVELLLQGGRIVHDVEQKLRKSDTFDTKTAVSITGIRGTEFRMKVIDADTNIVETLKGKVQLQNSDSQRIIVEQGEGAKVKKGEVLRPPRPLPIQPKTPILESVYRTLPIKIATSKISRADTIRLRVTKDEKGQYSVVEKQTVPGSDLWIPSLEDGSYHVFFTVVDEDGFESSATESASLTVRTVPGSPVISSPSGDYTSWNETVDIHWLESEQAVRYSIELASDEMFTTIIDRQDLTDVYYKTPSLAVGTYYFRVRAIAEDGFESNFSHPIHFEKVEQPTMGNIETSSSDGIHFQWPKIVKNCTYDIEIAKSVNFSSLFQSQSGLSDNKFVLKGHVPHGTYYVRIRATLENGLQSQWTPVQKMVIKYQSTGWEYIMMGAFIFALIIL